MSLKQALDEMEWRKAAVYDRSTGCEVDRDGDGEVILTMDGGTRSVTYTLRDLIRGPCAGLKGARLEQRIREFMEQALVNEEHYGPCIEEEM